MTVFYSSGILFDKCLFDENQAIKNTRGLNIAFSNVNLTNSEFTTSTYEDDYEYILGSYMFIQSDTNVTVEYCTFHKGKAAYGGAIYIIGDASL
jgi:hypothetical protein